jgi:hypothetical protein
MASKRERKKASTQTIEITRSFAYKLNVGLHGGSQYESADFFQSMKTTAPADQAEAVGEKLYTACRRDVLKAINAHIQDIQTGAWAKQVDLHPAAKENRAEHQRRMADIAANRSAARRQMPQGKTELPPPAEPRLGDGTEVPIGGLASTDEEAQG